MVQWQQRLLGDCLTLKSGGTPSKARNDYWGGDIPWVSCKDMKVDQIHDAEDHLTALGVENGTRLVPANTILFVVRGMILARDFPVAMTKRTVAFNQDLKAAEPADFIDTEFLFHWFRANTYEILGRADEAGHGTKRIQTDRLLAMPISVPPLPVQQRIAGILSAYDELIENSQRRIRILETMARALYREWFVLFRFPGHEKVPRVSSSLGEIPKGWAVKPIQYFGKVITGKTPSKANADFYGEVVPFVKTPDMHGNMFILGTNESLSVAGAESQANKTLPAGSICVSCIGTIGVVSITTGDCQTNQQINSVVLTNEAYREFLFLRLQDAKQALENLGSNGATMGNVNKGKFETMEVVCPPIDLLTRYHQTVEPMFLAILARSRQIQNLRRTRDLLLPRLLSGELVI